MENNKNESNNGSNEKVRPYDIDLDRMYKKYKEKDLNATEKVIVTITPELKVRERPTGNSKEVCKFKTNEVLYASSILYEDPEIEGKEWYHILKGPGCEVDGFVEKKSVERFYNLGK